MTIAPMNYDPNLTCCGRMAIQQVRLTFGTWTYRAVMDVSVSGNCTGIAVIDCAVSNAYYNLEQRGNNCSDGTYAVIVMVDPEKSGSTLECSEDDPGGVQGEQWLGAMLISAEIISITPEN